MILTHNIILILHRIGNISARVVDLFKRVLKQAGVGHNVKLL